MSWSCTATAARRSCAGCWRGCSAAAPAPAQPGEFTKRAFLNGRLDLAQAEAVIELVRARTTGAAQLAAQQLTGHLSAHLDELRDRLIRLKALLEAQIDFSDEDVDVAPAELLDIHRCMHRRYRSLLVSTYAHGKLMRDGVRVAIIGKPNVGKSSLLNALLGEERAIVTPIAGTTRDTIEEAADFDGIPVVLTDTAGLRQMEHADPVERMGMQRTSGTIAEAQLVLPVLDASRRSTPKIWPCWTPHVGCRRCWCSTRSISAPPAFDASARSRMVSRSCRCLRKQRSRLAGAAAGRGDRRDPRPARWSTPARC